VCAQRQAVGPLCPHPTEIAAKVVEGTIVDAEMRIDGVVVLAVMLGTTVLDQVVAVGIEVMAAVVVGPRTTALTRMSRDPFAQD
jgi:hypothetical protein